MWRYISPAAVFPTSFSTDTTVKSGLIFKSIKKRGSGLANIDAALDSLRDNFRPKTQPAETAGHLILVLRQAKAWLRKMEMKKHKNAKESKSRIQKRQAIERLAKESLDMLVFCSPSLAKALESFNTHKAQGNAFTTKSLSTGYDRERNLYLKNNKTGLTTVSGSTVHGYMEYGNKKFNKQELSTMSGGAKSVLKKVNQGKLDFNQLSDMDFKYLGELASAKTDLAEVQFFDKLERLKLLCTIDNGLLKSADGTPFATSGLSAPPPDGQFQPKDQWMWAMDGHGNLFASDQLVRDGKNFNHSSYMAGKAVACAGTLVTSATGKLLMISNGSGHYKPTRENLFEAVAFLAHDGADISQCTVWAQAFENGQPYVYFFDATAFIANPQAQPREKFPGRLQ